MPGQTYDLRVQSFCSYISIFRAQYLLETFGHRGNIYIVQDYLPETWVQHGGEVHGYDKLADIRSGKAFDDLRADYAYIPKRELVKGYKDIKDFQNYSDFKEQNRRQSMTS